MAYQKQDWRDLPDETTPISAERLIHMEDGIYEASLTEVVNSMDGNETDKVPSVNAVKNYIDNVPNIVLDGPEVKMNYKVDGKDVYAKKFTLGTGTTPGKQKTFDLTKFGFTADNHNKISYECINHLGYQLPNITGDGWSQYGWLNDATVYKIKNGDLIDTTGDTLYLTIYYTKTTD